MNFHTQDVPAQVKVSISDIKSSLFLLLQTKRHDVYLGRHWAFREHCYFVCPSFFTLWSFYLPQKAFLPHPPARAFHLMSMHITGAYLATHSPTYHPSKTPWPQHSGNPGTGNQRAAPRGHVFFFVLACLCMSSVRVKVLLHVWQTWWKREKASVVVRSSACGERVE